MKVNVGLTSIGEEHARGHPHMMFNEKKYDEHYIKLAELGRGSKNTNTLWTSHIEAPKMPVPTSKIERTKRGKLGRSPASSRLILHCETLAWEVSCTYIVHQNYFLPFLLFCQQAMLPCIIQKEHFHSCLGRFQGPQVRLDMPGVWEYTGDHF